LAPDGSLEAPVVDVVQDAGASFTVGSALSPGRYTWRVATRSADGEEGPFGDWQSFTRRPPPAVPTVGPPRHDAGVVTLSWSVAEEGSRYSLQLARDPQFTDLVLEQTVSSAEARLERPAPGRYFLRVRAIGPDGFESEFGPAQSFDIEAPAPPRKTWPWRRLLLPAVPVVLVILLL
jgi:hypothetical protein